VSFCSYFQGGRHSGKNCYPSQYQPDGFSLIDSSEEIVIEQPLRERFVPWRFLQALAVAGWAISDPRESSYDLRGGFWRTEACLEGILRLPGLITDSARRNLSTGAI